MAKVFTYCTSVKVWVLVGKVLNLLIQAEVLQNNHPLKHEPVLY